MTERYKPSLPDDQSKDNCRVRYQTESGISIPLSEDGRSRKNLLSYKSPEGMNPKELSIEGARLLIPRYNIFGIQPLEDYSTKDERATKQTYKKYGDALLYENPVFLCALESNSLMTLALIDGHHRTRYAGAYGINRIPSIIFTPEQATKLWNDSPDTLKKFDDTEEFRKWLDEGVTEALASFRGMSVEKVPKILPNISSVDDLAQKFEAF